MATICAICLRNKKPKFKTGRLTICTRCVTLLNETPLSARDAMKRLEEELLANVIHRHGPSDGASSWVARRFPGILDEWCKDPNRMGVPLKVVRAYRRNLVCLDRRYLDYPTDWLMLTYRHKHRSKYTCNTCRRRDESCGDLQSHHIVFRSRSGTNYAANIVVLCLDCHQRQHPTHPLSGLGGEPRGFDSETTAVSIDDDDDSAVQQAPPSLWIPDRPTMTPLRPPSVPDEQPIQAQRSVESPSAEAKVSPPPAVPEASRDVEPTGDNAAVAWVLVIVGLIVFLLLL